MTAASSDDSTATAAPAEETASPDAEETTAPTEEATTLGEFVSLTATKADTLTAVFDSAVPTDATVVVENQYGTVSGSSSISDTTITFTGTASFSEDTYTMTVSYGDASRSMSAEVVAEYVASIEILNDTALTGTSDTEGGSDNDLAYVYYDVYNQYGESLKETTSITWNISSGDSNSVDRTKGKITIKKDDGWSYGDIIAIVGVYTGNGISATTTKTVTVGLPQALDSVEFAGFVSTDDTQTIEKSLPNDFAKGKWYLLYTAKDQNGNEMDADSFVESGSVTFVSDAPLLVDSSSFEDGKIYTIGETSYSSVSIQPGSYVDKGGEVNITAVSTKTGTKSTINVVIGSNGLLASLVLSQPSSVVANGDQDVTIPYEATDTDGNKVTNYETIVRSTNALTLKASQGTLKVKENADGSASITWSDEYTATNTKEAKYVFAEGSKICYDGQDQTISLTTVVVGGESSSTMLTVSDARMPSAVSSYAGGPNWNNYVAVGDEIAFTYNDSWEYGGGENLTFLDQYGATLGDDPEKAFFTWTENNAIGKNYYGIKYTVSSSAAFGADSANDTTIVKGTGAYTLTAAVEDEAIVKISLVTNTTGLDAEEEKWDAVSKSYSVTLTTCNINSLNGLYIGDIGLLQIETNASNCANGYTAELEDVIGEAVGDERLELKNNNGDGITVKVYGTYKGKTVVLPEWDGLYIVSEENFVNSGYDEGWSSPVITAITSDALHWSDLYDVNTARLTRKNATLTLEVTMTNDGTKLTKKVEVSDAASAVTELYVGGAYQSASLTNIYSGWWDSESWYSDWYQNYYAKDQYGNHISAGSLTITISSINESTSSLTHLANSFTVNNNGTDKTSITGAEVGDTYTLTFTFTDTNGNEMSVDKTVTVQADTQAYIDSNGDGSVATTTETEDGDKETVNGTKDKGLREILGYDR